MADWVRRRTSQELSCDGCFDSICAGCRFYLYLSGERFCLDCPPEEDDECPV